MIHPLQRDVVSWAREKGILHKSWPKQQFRKVMEEAGELGDKIAENNLDGIHMELGDTLVSLVILAEMYGTSAQDCLALAYNKIKGRTGTMQDGLFVKDK